MRKAAIFLFFSFIAHFSAKAQEGVPVYFDYLSDNYYLIFPSMAGINEGGKIRGTIRKQWFDVDNAPNLQTLNANVRLGEKSGVGAIFFNDANGYHSQTGVKATYAHHLPLGGDVRALNQLSFGLNVGLQQSNLDESEFVSVNPDPIISGTKNSATYFNVDIGASYNVLEFYAHVAVLNLLGSGRDLYTAEETDNLRRYLLAAGYVFGRDKWMFEPSVMLQMTEYTSEKSLDINGKVYRNFDNAVLWGGVSYRRSFDGNKGFSYENDSSNALQLITPIIGVNFKNFMFSYNYSYQTGDYRFSSGGFHQITLGYDFGQQESKRYDCKCPAVNL